MLQIAVPGTRITANFASVSHSLVVMGTDNRRAACSANFAGVGVMNSRQLFQLVGGATTGTRVWPAPGFSVAPANGALLANRRAATRRDSS